MLGKQGKARNAHEAAVVVMKPDGAVVALIGGRDYDDSVFNRATQAHRQPGSSFKPFVYLAALEQGISPWDLRTDEPVDINGWTPTNYGGEQFGTITVADALAHSVNTITAELAQEVGVTTVVTRPHALRHHHAAGGSAVAGAGHLAGDAARDDRRLCGVRQWRHEGDALFRHRSRRCGGQYPLSPRAAQAAARSSPPMSTAI